jgi:hypothetical protein
MLIEKKIKKIFGNGNNYYDYDKINNNNNDNNNNNIINDDNIYIDISLKI